LGEIKIAGGEVQKASYGRSDVAQVEGLVFPFRYVLFPAHDLVGFNQLSVPRRQDDAELLLPTLENQRG